MTMMNTMKIESLVANLEDDYSLEEILEMFDITPQDVLSLLFNNGYLDEELIDNLCTGEL